MAVNQLVIDWVDENGNRSKSRWWTDETDPTVVLPLINALKKFSAAAIERYGIELGASPASAISSSSGPFDALDKCVLEFLDSGGNTYTFTFADPAAAIFLADGKTVDKTNAQIIALDSAVRATARTRGGLSLTSLVRWYRIRSRRNI